MVWSQELAEILKEERDVSHYKKGINLSDHVLDSLIKAYYNDVELSVADIEFKDLDRVIEKTIELKKDFGSQLNQEQATEYWTAALKEITLAAVHRCHTENSMIIYEVIAANRDEDNYVRIISNPYTNRLEITLDCSNEYTIKEMSSPKLKEKGHGIIDLISAKPSPWHNTWETYDALNAEFNN